MKKFLMSLRIFILVGIAIIVALTLIRKISDDTPLPHSEKDGWYDFYSGKYVGGIDLPAGSYDVVIRGSGAYGQVLYYASMKDLEEHNFYSLFNIIHENGFHLSIKEGEVVEVDIIKVEEMKIKKIGTI